MISRVLRNARAGLPSRLALKATTASVLSHHFNFPLGHASSSPIFKRSQSSATLPNKLEGELLLQFTCNVCNNRSSHHISKQAYDHGTVLVQCPSCKSRHLIADNLGFMEYNKKFNLQNYLNSKGESIETNPNVVEFNDLPPELKDTLQEINDDGPPPEHELDLPKPEENKK
ncbi:Mitochondrial protein import protein ZIM17 [Candida viswanathii]|uniref:Mitochondrial protein import protein ZIM17 n=1 Tax=Candida viswanathii TaxID=5486 RepID=A0A367YHG5_9ASCO|nr:Mitochondrial protein import protein ZIM17 [Candida viswanathii]